MTAMVTETEDHRPSPLWEDDEGFERLLRGVQAWHLFLAGVSTWVLVNIAAGIWELGVPPANGPGHRRCRSGWASTCSWWSSSGAASGWDAPCPSS